MIELNQDCIPKISLFPNHPLTLHVCLSGKLKSWSVLADSDCTENRQ